jgi:hypothetical protein
MIFVGSAACLPWSFVVIPLMDAGNSIFLVTSKVFQQLERHRRVD